MEYIFTPHTSPSFTPQTRPQVHNHVNLMLYSSSTIQIFNSQKPYIPLIHSINPHTIDSSNLHYQFLHQPAPSLLPTLASHHHSTLQIHTHYSHPSPISSDLTAHTLKCPSFHNHCFQQPILHYPVFMILLTPTYHIQTCTSISAPPTSFYFLQHSQLLPAHSLPLPSLTIHTTLLTTHSSSLHLHNHFFASHFPAVSTTAPTSSSTNHNSFNLDIFSAHQILPYQMYQPCLESLRKPNAPPAQQHFKMEFITKSPTQVTFLSNPCIKTNPSHLLLTQTLIYVPSSYIVPNSFFASLTLLTYFVNSNTLHDCAGSKLFHNSMARTKVSASLTGQSNDTQCSSDKSTKSQASGSRKKRLTIKMDLLALQHSSQPAGSPMLLPPTKRAQLLAGQV
jgi:hypothetical protein